MEVAIVGIGCLSILGNDVDEIWNAMNETSDYQDLIYNTKYEFTSYLKGSSRRRTSRQASICRYTLEKAIEDSAKYIDINEIDENTGTIYAADYASLDANIQFTKQVVENKLESCSPTIFVNTVANSVLSTLCIPKQYKGVSTMLLESSSLTDARNMIVEERAERIFAGWISEYNNDLFQCYQTIYNRQCLAEGAVTFLLQKNNESMKDHCYCNIKSICQINLGKNPWKKDSAEQQTESLIQHCVQTCISKSQDIIPDVIISAGVQSEMKEIEENAYVSIIPNVTIMDQVTTLFGVVGEGSLEFNIMVAALCIKHGTIPCRFRNSENIENVHSVLVSGYNKIGNYTSILLSNQ